MFRRVVPVIVLLAGLAQGVAQAQTNIDQGKSPAEMFSNDCATCHKSARGLANGRGSSGLASFLTEHYTASKDEAGALAAYVMGAGGGDAVPAQTRGPKPAPTDHGRAAVEEPKPPVRGGVRTPGKPEEASTSAKPRPTEDEANRPSGSVPIANPEPGAKPLPGRPQPAVATRGRRKEQEPTQPASEPPAIVAEPAPSSAPAQPAPDVNPSAAAPAPAQSAAAPANAESGENTQVPRDDIPD